MRSNGVPSTSWRRPARWSAPRTRRRRKSARTARPLSVRSTSVKPSLVDVLDAVDLRPPARQVMRIGDRRARAVGRRAAIRCGAPSARLTRLFRVVAQQRVDVVAGAAARGRRGTPARSGTRSRRPRRRAARRARTARCAVPPVASRSSWTSTRAPPATASECSSSASVAVLQQVLGADGLVRAACPACAPARSRRPARSASAGAEQEPARLRADDDVDLQRPRVVGQRASTASSQRPGVGHQRRDVLEDDPRLREVRDVADVGRAGRRVTAGSARRSCAGRGSAAGA